MKLRWKYWILGLTTSMLMACANGPVVLQSEPEVSPPSEMIIVVDKSALLQEETPLKEQDLITRGKVASDGKLVLGAKEWVYVPSINANFDTRIDTGATTSSISATGMRFFKRDKQEWVSFRIEHEKILSEEMTLPIERWVKIRQSSTEEAHRRPIVMMWIQLGDRMEKTEFTLTDRTHLTHPLLLGRSFFNGIAIVDVSRLYVQDKHDD